MLPDDQEELPLSSFQWPLPVPTSDPDAGTLYQVCFNPDYLPLVLGCLLQALEQTTWDTTDPDVLTLAQSRANTLIVMFQEGCPVITPGMIIEYAGASAPDGWLLCDGSAVSRTTYAALFTAIGTAYGPGDGSTTFNLPNMGGRVGVGVGSSGGSSFALAASGGEETHTLITAEIPAHSHADAGHTHGIGTDVPTGTAVPPPLDAGLTLPIPPNATGVGFASIQNTGGGDAHNNLQPYLALNYLIRW